VLVPLGSLDPVDGAVLSDAFVTAHAAIAPALRRLGPGAVAVVLGLGGVGSAALQLLRALTPARAIGIDRDASRLAGTGADEAIPAEDAAPRVRELTDGEGADVVFDVVGDAGSVASSLAMLRNRGHYSVIGGGRATLEFGLYTVPPGSSFHTTFAGSVCDLRAVVALATAGRISLTATRYALRDAGRAYADLAAGRIPGRAVVVP